MTIIRLNSGEAAELLAAHLHEQDDLAVELAQNGEIRVNVLGSYGAEAMRLELFLRMRAWEASQRAKGNDVRIELADG